LWVRSFAHGLRYCRRLLYQLAGLDPLTGEALAM
jgi:hypothetical protein